MNRIEKLTEKIAVARSKMAVWMATGYYKDLVSQSNWLQHGAREIDQISSELLKMLSSPIEDKEIGTALRKVRALKITLSSLSGVISKELQSVENLEDELMRRANNG
jgi:hypothetical protein